jgi:FdhD protein
MGASEDERVVEVTRQLARGFLVSEKVISSADEISSLRHCDTVDSPEAEDNVVQVVLAPGVEVDIAALRRNFFAGSSCGICGKATIEAALQRSAPLDPPGWKIERETLARIPSLLRDAQEVFSQTGGSHAAGLFTPAGELRVLREDVGRHNAVDKVVGWALSEGEVLGDRVLMVSGRVSYEIIQKAAAARIPVVCAVSAASSLAIEFASEVNVALISFVRGDRMCVYTGESVVSE